MAKLSGFLYVGVSFFLLRKMWVLHVKMSLFLSRLHACGEKLCHAYFAKISYIFLGIPRIPRGLKPSPIPGFPVRSSLQIFFWCRQLRRIFNMLAFRLFFFLFFFILRRMG